jgi:hypothetical protein
MYYAVANPTNRDIEGATLRLTVAWVPENERGPREVLPLEIDASPIVGESSTFDIPPGLSTRSMEFTLPISGTVLHLGGHLHDHGVELRLEDVETGKILVRLGTTRDAEGHLVRVDRSGFLMRVRGLHLSADHPYRIVGVYDNHTCATISGAMAGIGAVFAPDKAAAIPSVDTTDALYMKDVRWLLAQGSSEPHAGHSTHHDRSTGGTCADQSKR